MLYLVLKVSWPNSLVFTIYSPCITKITYDQEWYKKIMLEKEQASKYFIIKNSSIKQCPQVIVNIFSDVFLVQSFSDATVTSLAILCKVRWGRLRSHFTFQANVTEIWLACFETYRPMHLCIQWPRSVLNIFKYLFLSRTLFKSYKHYFSIPE